MKILIAFILVSTACAMHLEYLKVDLDEEQHNESLAIGQGEDVPEIFDKVACSVCKKAMTKVKKHLGNKERANVIKEKLHKVCEHFGLLKGKCKTIISKYIDVLVDELSTTDDPATICAKIHLCKSKPLLEFIQDFPEVQQML